MTPRRLLDLAPLAALALLSLVPLVVALRLAERTGGSFAGSDGPFVADQFQYLAWIREFGTGVLAANNLDIAPRERVFLHPMFLISGLAWKSGLGIGTAYLLWKPVAIVALFLGFRVYVARFLDDGWHRLSALALALFFATPVAALFAWGELGSEAARGDILDVSGELLPATLLWGYLPAAISVGLLPLFLVGAERLVREAAEGGGPRRRELILVAACGAVVSWLHPWQGEVVLATVLAAAALGRFSRPYRVLAIPLAAVVAPLAYYFLLSRADSAWSLAAEANAAKGHVSAWAIVLAVLPLAAVACLGLRGPAEDFGERMLRLWPLAALLVYLILAPSFPQHAFEGLSLPLAVLAVRGMSRLRQPRAVTAIVVAGLTLPSLAYTIDWVRDTVNGGVQAHSLERGEEQALNYLDREEAAGGVLTRLRLGPLVPALSGRQTWVGHPSWTRDFDARARRAEALFGARLSRQAALALLRSSGAEFVLSDCDSSSAHLDRLSPALGSPRRFGCASVYRVER